MSALASYDERRFEGRRLFELHADRLVVKGKQSLGPDFEQIILLSSLQPVVGTVRARARGFGSGILMVIAAGVLLQGDAVSAMSYWGGIVLVMQSTQLSEPPHQLAF